MNVQVAMVDLLQKIGLLTMENEALRQANTTYAEEAGQSKAAVKLAEVEIARLRHHCGEEGL